MRQGGWLRRFDRNHDSSSEWATQSEFGVPRMAVLYDSEVFADGENISYHYNNGKTLPDGVTDFLAGLPHGRDVMLDLEALGISYFNSITTQERTSRLDYLGDVVASIRDQARSLGRDDRRWFWYGPPSAPPENPSQNESEIRGVIDEIVANGQKFLGEFDAWTTPCYDRYDGPDNFAQWTTRVTNRYTWAEAIEMPKHAILMPHHVDFHNVTELRDEAFSQSRFKEMYDVVDQVYDGVLLWQAPESLGYGNPDNYDDYRDRRHELLGYMRDSW